MIYPLKYLIEIYYFLKDILYYDFEKER